MSKWIRGRLGRPIASIISVLMLVSLLLPLAPPPAQAQTPDLDAFFGTDHTIPTRIVVLDFYNESNYKTGMLGRVFSDALSIELLNTRTFEVVKRSEVEAVLDQENLTGKLPWEAQAMVADRVQKCPFTVAGTIDDVKIRKTREGTFAEVVLSALVISRITKLPINGAKVIQRSSPKIGYSGNNDVLVQEALRTAAYQVAQRLLDNRLPIATVLTSPRSGEVALKGGSLIGFRRGMELVTIRRETLTGRLRVTSVTPTDMRAELLEESKGVAPGDKAVPIFELETRNRFDKEDRERAGLQIASYAALGILGILLTTQNGDKQLREGLPTPTASAMADAVSMGYEGGANLVRWPAQNNRVVAFVIYRDTSDAPIAVVDGRTNIYVDDGSPLPSGAIAEQTAVSIEVDESTGDVTAFTKDISYIDEEDTDVVNGGLTVDETTVEATTVRIPLEPGQTCGYRIRAIFVEFDPGGLDDEGPGHPENYKLYLGAHSGVSARITMTEPPTLLSPASGQLPISGEYRCMRVPGAHSYVLQLSSDSAFSTSEYVSAQLDSTDINNAVATLSDEDLRALFPAGNDNSQPIYWRMGARVDGQPLPVPQANINQRDWVFSAPSFFLLPPASSASYGIRRGGFGGGVIMGPRKTGASGRQGRSRDRLLRR